MPDPYSYTDPQNHRLTVRTATDAGHRPYVWLQAENLAIGGAMANVWLPLEQARGLANGLDVRAAYEFVDHTGDRITIGPSADDWTRFTLTRVEHADGEESVTIRVVVLTGRLPEVAAAITAAADRADQCEQHPDAPRIAGLCGGCTIVPPAKSTHEGPDPSHGGLTTHRGTREQCAGPDCGPAEEQRLMIEAHRDTRYTNGHQLSITKLDENGTGHGYRIAGPKFAGYSEVLMRHTLDERDAREIRTLLDAVFPAASEPAAPVLSDSVRQFLTFALDQAAEEMSLRDGFTDDDEQALATLRRLAGGEQPAAEQPATPAVGQRYTSRTDPARVVTVTRAWQPPLDDQPAVAFEWRDNQPGQCSGALPLDVFHRAYALEQS